MIVRRWEARATPEGAEQYERHFATVGLEKLRTIDGFRGAQVLRSVGQDTDRPHVVDLTYWDSLDAITAFAGADVRTAIVDETAQQYLLDFDRVATHYALDVDERATSV
jgi:heme-degrading monooxygenase HmoA